MNKGDIAGFVGFLGSGKEETAKSLFGLNKTVSRNFMMDKKPIALGQSVSYYVHRGIGYIPEDRLTEGLCLKSSIFDNIQITVFDLLKNVFGFLNKKALTQISLKKKEELTLKAVNMNLSTDTLSREN